MGNKPQYRPAARCWAAMFVHRGTGATQMQDKPNPGSAEAIAIGCRCPIGAGDGRGNFLVSELCPVHAVKENDK